MDLNSVRIKGFLSRMILYPIKQNQPDKKPFVPEASTKKLISLEVLYKILLKVLLNYLKKKKDIVSLLLLLKWNRNEDWKKLKTKINKS